MKFLIIGCGSIGRRHAGNLLGLGHEVVAYNRGERRRAAMAASLGIKVYGRLEEMLDEEQADAAVVCTPQHKHLDHSMAAARRGLHLFIEKPVAAELDGLDVLRSEVEKRSLVTHVGSNMRFHFGPRTLKGLMVENAIGRPLWSSVWAGMHLPDWHPDEDYRLMYSASKAQGGGAVMDFIHEIDLIQWLFGRPDEVAAVIGRSGWLEIETEDTVDAVMRFGRGMQANLHVDYLQRPNQRGIRVVGESGWVEWDLVREGVEHYSHHDCESHWTGYPERYNHNEMYVDQMRYFVSRLEEGRPSESALESGIQALELALRIKQSSNNQIYSCVE